MWLFEYLFHHIHHLRLSIPLREGLAFHPIPLAVPKTPLHSQRGQLIGICWIKIISVCAPLLIDYIYEMLYIPFPFGILCIFPTNKGTSKSSSAFNLIFSEWNLPPSWFNIFSRSLFLYGFIALKNFSFPPKNLLDYLLELIHI